MKFTLLGPAILASCLMSIGLNHQKANAYEAHEFVFLRNLTNIGNNQSVADQICNHNFRDLRGQGVFNESVEENTWHVWAHLDNQECIMNIRMHNFDGYDRGTWVPSNNDKKRFPLRIPRFK